MQPKLYLQFTGPCLGPEEHNTSEPHHEKKLVFAICKQQRHRSACIFVQSDQCLCDSLLRYYNTNPKFQTLAYI